VFATIDTRPGVVASQCGAAASSRRNVVVHSGRSQNLFRVACGTERPPASVVEFEHIVEQGTGSPPSALSSS
jgi:hypothetical protein